MKWTFHHSEVLFKCILSHLFFFFPVQYNLLVHWTVDVCMFSENQESGVCHKKKRWMYSMAHISNLLLSSWLVYLDVNPPIL